MAGKGVEVGKAYVSIAARMDGMGDQIKRELDKLGVQFTKSGESAGRSFTKSVDRSSSSLSSSLGQSGEKAGKEFSKSLSSSASSGMRKLESTAKTAGSKVGSSLSNGIQKGCSLASKALGGLALGGAASLGAFVVDAARSASDIEQSMGGVSAVFKGNSDVIIESSKKNSAQMELNMMEYQNYASKFGAIFQSAGASVKESSDMTIQYMQRAADFAGNHNYDTKATIEAFTAAAAGRTAGLRRLGITIDEEELKEEHYRLTGEKVKGTLTAQAKQMATYSLIMKKTGGEVGGMAGKMETLEGRQNRLHAQMDNMRFQLGEALLPVMLKVSETIINISDRMTNASGGWKTAIKVIGGLSAASLGFALAGKGVTSMISGVSKGFKLVAKVASKAVIPAIKGISMAMRANPLGAAITAATILVGLGVALYKNWAPFRKFVDGIGGAAKKAFEGIVSGAQDLGEKLGEWWHDRTGQLKASLNEVKQFVSKTVGAMKEHVGGFFTKIGEIGETVGNAIKRGFTTVIEAAIRPVAHALGTLLSHLPNVPGTSVDDSARAAGARLLALKTGGAVYGAGTGTSDSIPAMLSNGEYVVKASAVKKIGVANLDRLNGLGYAEGGLVTYDDFYNFLNGSVNGKSLSGDAYNFGGISWGDCSGTQGSAAAYAVGEAPFDARKFATGTEGDWLASHGFTMGTGATPPFYGVGWMNGGPGGGHTSGTITDDSGSALNFEMGGTGSSGKIGGAAASWRDSQFTNFAWIPLAKTSVDVSPDVSSADSVSVSSSTDSSSSYGKYGVKEEDIDDVTDQQTWSDMAGELAGKVVKSAVAGQLSDILGVFGIDDTLPPALSGAMQFGKGIRDAQRQLDEDAAKRAEEDQKEYERAREDISKIDDELADSQEKISVDLPAAIQEKELALRQAENNLTQTRSNPKATPEQVKAKELQVEKAKRNLEKAKRELEKEKKKQEELRRAKEEAVAYADEYERKQASMSQDEKAWYSGLIPGVDGDSAIQKFANGGKVVGQPGEDKIRAMLSNGEFVLNKETVDKLGTDALEALNSTGGDERSLRAALPNMALAAYDQNVPDFAREAASSAVQMGGKAVSSTVRAGGQAAGAAVQAGGGALGSAISAIPVVGALGSALSVGSNAAGSMISMGSGFAADAIDFVTPIAAGLAGEGASQVAQAGGRMMHAGVDTLNANIPTLGEIGGELGVNVAGLNAAAAMPGRMVAQATQSASRQSGSGGNTYNFYGIAQDMKAKYNEMALADRMGLNQVMV